jgi:hypothetical protein
MQTMVEYLERAQQFEHMAQNAADPALRANVIEQAEAYRKLAHKRAEEHGIPIPPIPKNSN